MEKAKEENKPPYSLETSFTKKDMKTNPRVMWASLYITDTKKHK